MNATFLSKYFHQIGPLFVYVSNQSLHYIKISSNKSLNLLNRCQCDPCCIYAQNKVKKSKETHFDS